MKFSLNLYCSMFSKLYFEILLKYWWWVFLKCKEKNVILSNVWFFSFHLIPNCCKSFKFSPSDCGKSKFDLWLIYFIEFMLFMNAHLNDCLLNFLGSRFKVEFRCAWWSTNPKISQALIGRKIPHTMFWWKWKTTWQSRF